MLTLYILKNINGVVCSDAYFNCAIDDHTLKGYSLGSNSRKRLVFSNNRMFLKV